MQHVRCSGWIFGGLILVGALGQAQTTTRVSVSSAGAEGNGHSTIGAISANGRYVAFGTAATNFAAGDTNGKTDVFVRERASGAMVLASTGIGAPANGNSYAGSLSSDGRHFVFSSEASNLVPNDVNGVSDVFVHDRITGAITRVSVSSSGEPGDGPSYVQPYGNSISADGRFVAFTSYAFNLSPSAFNEFGDVYVHDLVSGVTTLISIGPTIEPGDAESGGATLSADGRFVAFQSESTNLVTPDVNATADVFVRDMQTGTLARVSVSSSGVQGSGFYPSISADGLHVGFVSYATNLVPGDTGAFADVFVHDIASATTTRVSVDSSGAQANGNSVFYFPALSTDGRFVAFGSTASNLVPNDTNGAMDVFLHDRATGSTERVSLGAGGAQGNGDTWTPSISADGRYVAFESLASNLVANDANAARDVFVHDRGTPGAFMPFCFGDGSGAPCPCGNLGAAGNGCASSVNANGAQLSASGGASVGDDTVVLQGSGMPDSSALYFQGTQPTSGGAGIAFGDGLRCASGQVIRLGVKANSGGSSSFPGAGDAPISIQGAISAGGVRQYQVWYRNAAAFCTPSTFNLSNGVEVLWAN